MGNLSGFNPADHQPMGDRSPLPNGDYLVAITASEVKQTKRGDGRYLQLEMSVVDGQHKGRKLWVRLNLWNPNATAVEIANSELSAICHATGVMSPNDSSEMHDIPFVASVVCKQRQDGQGMANEVKGYKSRKDAGQVAPQQQPQAATASSTPPWQR